MNLSLFPKSEEWGTGDEALDIKLSSALKKTADSLSLQSISEFYFYGIALKPRAYNPALSHTIEYVTKALLFHLDPDAYNDFLFKKLKGHYEEKSRIDFNGTDFSDVIHELKKNNHYRYKGQIDFYLHAQKTSERNPFVQNEISKSPSDLQAKIVFKEFKNFLNGELTKETYSDAFFQALKAGKHSLVIENFAEIWYDNDQLFSLNLMS